MIAVHISPKWKSNFGALVNNKSFSDVVFIVEGVKIYAHKNVLSARCDKFKY